MAKLNGMSIKNLHHFEGMEGIAYQGDLYLGSKKIGFWSQNGNGGADRFDFEPQYSRRKFLELVAATHEPYHTCDGSSVPFDGELFMCELLDMTLTEKDYKKFVKQGYELIIKAGFLNYSDMVFAFSGISESQAKNRIVEELESDYPFLADGHYPITCTVLHSVYDFVEGDPYKIADLLVDI